MTDPDPTVASDQVHDLLAHWQRRLPDDAGEAFRADLEAALRLVQAVERDRDDARADRARAEAAANALAGDQEAGEEAVKLAQTAHAERQGLLTVAWRAAVLCRVLARPDTHETAETAASALGEALETVIGNDSTRASRYDLEFRAETLMLTAETDTAIGIKPLRQGQFRRDWCASLEQRRNEQERRCAQAERLYEEARRQARALEAHTHTVRAKARAQLAQVAAHVADAAPDEAAWLTELATPKVPRPLAPSEQIARLQGYCIAAGEVIHGLQGAPFHWRGVDGQHNLPRLADMGVTLVSKSHAERLGYRLKRDAQPVGSRYFGAPISRQADVYVLECQCVPATQGEEAS